MYLLAMWLPWLLEPCESETKMSSWSQRRCHVEAHRRGSPFHLPRNQIWLPTKHQSALVGRTAQPPQPFRWEGERRERRDHARFVEEVLSIRRDLG